MNVSFLLFYVWREMKYIFNLNFEKKLYYDIFLLLNEFVSNSNNN